MKKQKIPSTAATRFLKVNKTEFKPLFYEYKEHGGTKEASKQLNIDEHRIVKTLVLEDSNKKGLIVLMNGDMEVSFKKLARLIGVKSVSLCKPDKANRYSGYVVGGTSPFGFKTKLPIYAQKDIFEYEKIIINGGQRGFLIEISTEKLKELLNPTIADIGLKEQN
ncbi:aminoacyl-tRNA deacylase [Hippea alviniae]|uniref:aminoacyl-tRNA deacylase n=1 Tax=Hippea alviniae TaxID=1279027 RepID=UPI00040F9ABF|nr:aminoacyl-tRNA deacylase [Hippea alviniae]